MKTILIADDEPHVLRILKLALTKEGYQVETAPNGKVALDKLRISHPDVLITDIQMPQMTGDVLCKQIAAEMPDRRFLIFVCTSRTEIEHREWSRQISNLTFLEKPVSIRKLKATLHEYFDESTQLDTSAHES